MESFSQVGETLVRTRRAVLAKGLEEGGGEGGGGGGGGKEGGDGGGPSRLRLPKSGVGHLIGSLPTDMTRRRPEESEGERRRWGGCPLGCFTKTLFQKSK